MRLSCIRRILIAASIVVSSLCALQAQEQAQVAALRDKGFENIRVVEGDGVSYVAFDDNIYRGVARGVEAAVDALRDVDSLRSYELLLQYNGIARASVSVPESGRDLEVSYNTEELSREFRGVRRTNRSFGRVDLVIYPELFLENWWLDRLYGYAVNISPAIEWSLWPGAKFTAQVVIPISTNMMDEKQYVRPGVIAFRQDVRILNRLYGSVSVGNFTDARIGIDGALSYYTADGGWGFGARVGYTGSSTFYQQEWIISRWQRCTWSGWASFYEPKYDLEFKAEVLQMVYKDRGVRGSVKRYFKSVSVGLYAMVTGGTPNGGFEFTVPFPCDKRLRRNSGVRVTYPEYFTRTYRALNGMTDLTNFDYKIEPGAGGLKDYYNPRYLNKQLSK